MTDAKKAVHALTHLPFHPGCPFCVTARRANVQHRTSHEGQRTIQFLVTDYGYGRDSNDEIMATVLVVRLYPYNVVFATIVEKKGSYPAIVKQVATWIQEAGLVHFTYRTDMEEAIRDLLEANVRESGRPGRPLDPEKVRLAREEELKTCRDMNVYACLLLSV